jgi:tetratricopeptide (TPR) repeat protein
VGLVGSGGARALISEGETQRGERYLRLGAYENAQPHFEKALRWNPSNGKARRSARLANLGALIPSLEENETAFSAALEEMKAKRPDDPLLRVFEGDRAFEIFRRESDPAQLDLAKASYQAAAGKDDDLAIAHARVGFIHDLFGELSMAEAAWRRGLELARGDAKLAAPYRGGLARVLAQQGQADQALRLYDGDPQDPRAGIEAAMLRWRTAAGTAESGETSADFDALEVARDRLERLKPQLHGKGPAKAWGFKADGTLVIFGRKEAHRCLYGWALAGTEHLLGHEQAARSALDAVEGGCKGGRADVKLVICDRLRQASGVGQPRAEATRDWLRCSPGLETKPTAR